MKIPAMMALVGHWVTIEAQESPTVGIDIYNPPINVTIDRHIVDRIIPKQRKTTTKEREGGRKDGGGGGGFNLTPPRLLHCLRNFQAEGDKQ